MFIAKSEDMKDSGRKITVTAVSIMMAASWRSLMDSTCFRFCFQELACGSDVGDVGLVVTHPIR